ncbi:cytochrome P450 [Kitasatospora sp. NRRL B-11411]|uniref:cytochrome P450 n=1 Tax=Kitasatospora sp. NRRL B-11411 TaxID=1463822 RepID=UPI0004C2C244|nr:cytochrome P450 [Kitasatospora sp. NRRL B-11411]
MGGTVAGRHESKLLWASRPALWALTRVTMSRPFGPLRRVPKLGWVARDPTLIRAVLNDHEHFTLLGEGGVGHLWEQVLGPYVTRLFDGPGHADLRRRARDLFTEDNSAALVERAAGPVYADVTERLTDGELVDVAAAARLVVGRLMADLLGLRLPPGSPDSAYLETFAAGERLAALALDTTASTELPPERIAAAKEIVATLTADVPDAFEHAGPDTLLGRCRESGITLEEASGLASLLLVAGTETAAGAMARTVALLHDTGQQGRLRADPALLRDAVREGLRVTTPAPVIGRHVSADVTVAGRRLLRDERILLVTYAADNLAGGFDLTRPYDPRSRQLWFGAGRHLCLGAPVARAEIARMVDAVHAPGRPYRIVSRTYARKVMIPSYGSLVVRLE